MKLKTHACKIIKRAGDKGIAYAGRKNSNVYAYSADGQLLLDKTFPSNAEAKRFLGFMHEI